MTMNELSWNERVAMLSILHYIEVSINPDAANREDIARLAAELMDAKYLLAALITEREALRDVCSHHFIRGLNCDCDACQAWKRVESILEKQK